MLRRGAGRVNLAAGVYPAVAMGREAEGHVRAAIEAKGRITFAEFMALALYGPGGYYTGGEAHRIGTAGDFFTSPHAHPAFGALIALQLEQMWRLLGSPERFDVIEAGAGGGRLARDIGDFASALDASFAAAVHYQEVEGYGSDLPDGFTGCLLSNELFDAFPVHRVRLVGGKLREVYVTLSEDEQFVEALGEPSTPRLASRLLSEGVELGEGWTAEVSLEAEDWMREAASRLERGYAITIDYGDPAERLYSERRRAGTLRAHYQHTASDDPYARVGRQDLTAHVDFTALIAAGEAAGLMPVTLMTQREFLTNLGAEVLLDAIAGSDGPKQADLKGLRSLVDPTGLGGFRVLVQAHDAPAAALACLEGEAARRDLESRLESGLAPPRLTAAHLDQLAGRPGGWTEWSPP